jgi:hypothetical protein
MFIDPNYKGLPTPLGVQCSASICEGKQLICSMVQIQNSSSMKNMALLKECALSNLRDL